ncbi:hypothetical protein FACS1894137_06740 [Spirochaetia bacterium]|nr:hypothetical protein FACS1894137_06740 [Spirochaetia bacterium]
MTAQDYIDRGLAQAAKGNYDASIADYTEAIRLEPDEANHWYNRGVTRFHTYKDVELIIKDLTEAIRLAPDRVDTYYARGIANYFQAKHVISMQEAVITESAKLEAERLALLSPLMNSGNGMALRWGDNLTRMLFSKRNKADALALETCGLLAPDYLKDAIADLTRVLSHEPDHDKAYLHRGHVYRLAGDKNRARADYEQVLSLVPNHPEAQKQLNELS